MAEDLTESDPSRPGGAPEGGRRVLVDGVLEGLVALPVLLVLHDLGWGGRAPVVVLIGCVVFGVACGFEALHRRLGGEGLDKRVHLRLALHVAGAAAIMYVTGWGPVLAPAFAILLTLHLEPPRVR